MRATPSADSETTVDRLLDGRVEIEQPRQGYRVAIDPVLLAAAVPARPGERVLDLGTGVGAAALCLARRVGGVAVTGLELQPELAGLARANAARNGLALEVADGDLAALPEAFRGAFDHVMANPPHHAVGRGTETPHRAKRVADVEGEAGLAAWIAAAAAAVRRRGTVTFVHRADRIDELLALMRAAGLGGIGIFPLWPKADGRPAARVLVQGRSAVRSPALVAAGLVLHGRDGRYTAAAEAVLRRGAAVQFRSPIV